MITRRSFIQKSVAAFALLSLPEILAARSFKKEIGLQLYTVRDQTSRDLNFTLRKLAEIGYNNLEAAGYADGKFYGMEPGDFRKLMKDHGMNLLSSHCGITEENAAEVIKAHRKAGVDYIVLPWIDLYETYAGNFLAVAKRLNKLGELCRKEKISFGYHNHDFEFANTQKGIGFDLMIENTDPDLVFFQLDVYWVKKAGYSALDYFRKYPGRFELLHLKDMAAGTASEDTEIGTGIIDFKAIMEARKMSGMKYFFIEQDNPKGDSLESVATSYQNLKQIL